MNVERKSIDETRLERLSTIGRENEGRSVLGLSHDGRSMLQFWSVPASVCYVQFVVMSVLNYLSVEEADRAFRIPIECTVTIIVPLKGMVSSKSILPPHAGKAPKFTIINYSSRNAI